MTQRRTLAFMAVLALCATGFTALGVWQLQRMAWKHALIARVQARVHATPVAIPVRAQWPQVSEVGDAYRRVYLSGHFLGGADAKTQALTELGRGSWVLSAFRADTGDTVFINRGFVPEGAAFQAPPSGYVRVTGLLRLSEPDGGFLHRNQPAAERWYSRDVAAIARARGLPLSSVAPFFIDVDADSNASTHAWPRGGMTVLRFRDAHLSYALTWFALALMTASAMVALWRMQRRVARV